MGYTDQNRCTAYVEVFRMTAAKSIPTTKGTPSRLPRAYDKLYETKVDPEGNPSPIPAGVYPDGQMEGPLGSAQPSEINGRVEFWELGLEKKTFRINVICIIKRWQDQREYR